MNIKQHTSYLTIVLLMALFSCHNITKDDSTVNSNEEFETFYQKFYDDSIFQISRVKFPLPGYNSNEVSGIPEDFAQEQGINFDQEPFFWSKDSWRLVEPLEKQDVDIQKALNESDTLVTEKLFIPNSGFLIEKRFERADDGKWYLTYYYYQNT